jgi:hypothetical protein
MKVWQDNLSTIHIANKGEGVGARAKHFRVKHQFGQNYVPCMCQEELY